MCLRLDSYCVFRVASLGMVSARQDSIHLQPAGKKPQATHEILEDHLS
jgi:hypothetical protein